MAAQDAEHQQPKKQVGLIFLRFKEFIKILQKRHNKRVRPYKVQNGNIFPEDKKQSTTW
jgi:hypothetical protein